jgi:tetratricopeptide (TPR) repeat protein
VIARAIAVGLGLTSLLLLAGPALAEAQPAAERAALKRRSAQVRSACARTRAERRRSGFAIPRAPYAPPEWMIRGGLQPDAPLDDAALARATALAHRQLAMLPPDDARRRPPAILHLAQLQVATADRAAARVAALENEVARAEVTGDATALRSGRQLLSAALLLRDRARAEATQSLEELIRAHPGYERLDLAVLLLARILESLGERVRAAWILRDHADRIASAPGAPAAWVAAADLLTTDGQAATALDFYERALEVPADRTPVHAYAQYRRAILLRDLGERRDATQAFLQLLVFLETHPTVPDRDALMDIATRDACSVVR